MRSVPRARTADRRSLGKAAICEAGRVRVAGKPRVLVLLFVAVLLLSACAGAGKARVTGRLRVEVGGRAPAVHAGYPGVIRAVKDGRIVTTTSTRSDGSFALSVSPGTYLFTGMWPPACVVPCPSRICAQTGPVHVTKKMHSLVIVCQLPSASA
jgi:hypothetical protein